MKKLNLRLLSNDAKKLAEFYGEIFNRETTSTREKGDIIYGCKISHNLTITFMNHHDLNSKVGLEFTVGLELRFIEKVLMDWNIPYEKQSSGANVSLQTKDPDGNELLFKKVFNVSMPIGY